jgi:hypothetical protein
MAIDDREWYRQAHIERERQRMQKDAAWWRFTRKRSGLLHRRPKPAPAWAISVAWVVVAMLVYAIVHYVRLKR